MGLVLWIDSNTFATGLLEKIFKKQKLPFYTLASASDFSYLVEDLKPELLVLDAATVLSEVGAFRRQYEASVTMQNLPVVILEPLPGLEFVMNIVGEIKRPFDPFSVPSLLETLFKSH